MKKVFGIGADNLIHMQAGCIAERVQSTKRKGLRRVFREADQTESGRATEGGGTPRHVAEAIVQRSCNALDNKLALIWKDLAWGEPAVAFYGETNAGKSTLIEALRLAFCSGDDRVGRSIGDGSPDFTRVGTAHVCEHNGKRFALVDVPGIEGDEAQVLTEIETAVRRAHVVYYVTADARAPQGGDRGREGTLEKIKRQLRPQAKVWAIYNKKVQNPRQFGTTLLTGDEAGSLAEGPQSLDAKMHEALGDQYQGHIAVSALPAFFALSERKPLDERLERRRSKFLPPAAPFSTAELLQHTNLWAVHAQILRSIPTHAEIVSANLRKLAQPVTEASNDLQRQAATEFGEPATIFANQLADLHPKLAAIADDGSKGIRRLVDEVTNGYVRRVRRTMLGSIERGLKDDDALRRELEAVIETERRGLPDMMKTRVSKNALRVQESTDEALYLVRKHLAEQRAFESASFAAAFTHAADANTRSGIELGNLAASVASLGLVATVTGPFAVAILAVTAIVGITRSVWNRFSTGFRRGEQKQALNRNLDALKSTLRSDVTAHLNTINYQLRAHVLGQIEPLAGAEAGLRQADSIVRDAAERMRRLAADGDGLRALAGRLGNPHR